MLGNKKCSYCGSKIKSSAKFCGSCGQSVTERITCPHCKEEVAQAKFCGKCGYTLKASGKSANTMPDWDHGSDIFATKLPETQTKNAAAGFTVRHGTKALFFENGRLVDIAESRRYTKGDSFLQKLFAKKRSLSALLVDAGDVILPFAVKELLSSDGIELGVSLDVVVRLEDHNRFYVNVMKDRDIFTIRELRNQLFSEVKNSLQEAIARFPFAQLQPSRGAKEEIASRLENHLRTTFNRMGFDFGQVRSMDFNQETLDATSKKASAKETAARDIEVDSRGDFRVGKAEQDARKLKRELKRGGLGEEREELDIEKEEQDISLEGKKQTGSHKLAEQKIDNEHKLAGQQGQHSFQLSHEHEDAEFISKRLEVYQKLKTVDIAKIKTDEDFRKFKLEIDRDKVLDDAEWQEFKEELLWQKEDRNRDRSFLIRKIELQQQFDTKRLEILNNSELSITVKEQKFQHAALDREEKQKILNHSIELSKQQQAAKEEIELQRAKHEAAVTEFKGLADKNLELQNGVKDLELRKARFDQELNEEQDKALARHEIATLDLELKKQKSAMAMANLEKMKSMKRRDLIEKDLHKMEMKERELGIQIKQDEIRSKIAIEEMQAAGKIEAERMDKIAGMSIEQLISISGLEQSQVLAELGQTQVMKGMSSEEIMAMKDPAALGRALEERAKGASGDELKTLYEKMMQQMEAGNEKVARAHQEAADRAERMSNTSINAMQNMHANSAAGAQMAASGLVTSERRAAEMAERMANQSMQQMGGVATTRSRPAEGGGPAQNGSGPEADKILICSSCKQEVNSTENFCPNCGQKMY